MKLKTSVTISSIVLASMSFSASADAAKKEILQFCQKNMGERGSAMVMACVKQEHQANLKFQSYGEELNITTSRCLVDMFGHGWAMTVACVEQDLQAKKELEQYMKD